jgi:hypothetical protein
MRNRFTMLITTFTKRPVIIVYGNERGIHGHPTRQGHYGEFHPGERGSLTVPP